MGVPIFGNLGINIAKLIKDNLAASCLPATLTKTTPGTRTPGQLTGGTNPTTTSYSCRGFIDTQEVMNRDGTLVVGGKKQVVLLGDTIDGGSGVAPEPGDMIEIEGSVYLITNDAEVGRDPAAATYTCGVRKL